MTGVIIAGAAGYVGSNLMRRLAPLCPILALTRHPGRTRSDPPGARITWCRFDDERAICAAASGFGEEIVIVNCAGESRESRMGITIEGNYDSMSHLIAVAKKLPVRQFVYFSGYGTGSPTSSAYFAAKSAAERLLRRSGLPWISLRCSYILGHNDEIFPFLLKAGKESGVIRYPGSGDYRLQPLHIDDVALLVEAIVMRDVMPSGAHELLGEKIAYRHLLQQVLTASGLKLRLESRNLEAYVAEATFQRHSELSLDQLAILVADKVGRPTHQLGGITFRPLADLIADLGSYWAEKVP